MKIGKILSRRKVFVAENVSDLSRSLKLFDLIALGLGSTLGLGVYVLAGQVSYNIAGPGVIMSFLIAGIASLFAAFCYAEFTSRVPCAGSAYTYSYVSIGEFIAFSIGWNMVLEYIIGTASLARGLSSYLDSMVYNKMSRFLVSIMPINLPHFAKYPDFLSFTVVLLLTILLIIGMKESSNFNIACTIMNLLTILLVICAGSIFADVENWKIPKEKVPEKYGDGGFLPYGIAGVLKGASTCFFGFVGFDGIATTAEEAINPKRNIPLAIMLSFIIVLAAYLGISIVLTLMVPYYEQSPTAPFPVAFERVNWSVVKWMVAIGALFALTTSLLGALFPLPRILYAMATDGLVFKCLSKVNSTTKTPIIATGVSGVISAIMALFFDLHQLVDMMSIGTLMAYIIVAVCVIILRYQDENMEDPEKRSCRAIRQIFNYNNYHQPNVLTSKIIKICLLIFMAISISWCTLTLFFEISSMTGVVVSSVAAVISFIVLIIIALQPKSKVQLSYRVPFVPLLPLISVFINLFLMYQLSLDTWIRLLVWVSIGYAIYFLYGIENSNLASQNQVEEKSN